MSLLPPSSEVLLCYFVVCETQRPPKTCNYPLADTRGGSQESEAPFLSARLRHLDAEWRIVSRRHKARIDSRGKQSVNISAPPPPSLPPRP